MKYTLQNKLFDNLIVFLLIMSSGGLLFVFNRNNMYYLFLVVLVIMFLPSKRLKKKVINSSILTFLSFFFFFSVNYLFAITEQSLTKYAYYMMVVTVCVATTTHFINNRTSDIFIRRLYLVLKLITFHAFVNFIAYHLVKNHLVTISTFNSLYDCQTFHNILFYASLEHKHALFSFLGLDFYRNQGLFWEAGVLQVFLNLFLYLEAFVFKKSKLLILLVVLTILSTYSTIGITILLLQVLYYIKTEMKNSKMLIPFVLVLAFPIYLVFSVNVEEKVVGEKEDSFQKRYFDLVQPFFMSLQNPLTGIGLDLNKFKEVRSESYFSSNFFDFIRDETGIEMKVENTDEGTSNSFMFLLSSMGFPTFIFFMYLFFKQTVFEHRKGAIYIITVFSLMTSPLLLRPFFFLFIISGLHQIFYKTLSRRNQIA